MHAQPSLRAEDTDGHSERRTLGVLTWTHMSFSTLPAYDGPRLLSLCRFFVFFLGFGVFICTGLFCPKSAFTSPCKCVVLKVVPQHRRTVRPLRRGPLSAGRPSQSPTAFADVLSGPVERFSPWRGLRGAGARQLLFLLTAPAGHVV